MNFRGNCSWTCPGTSCSPQHWAPADSQLQGDKFWGDLTFWVVSHLYGAHPPSCCSPAVRWHLRKIRIKGKKKKKSRFMSCWCTQGSSLLLCTGAWLWLCTGTAGDAVHMKKKRMFTIWGFVSSKENYLFLCRQKRKKKIVIERISSPCWITFRISFILFTFTFCFVASPWSFGIF